MTHFNSSVYIIIFSSLSKHRTNFQHLPILCYPYIFCNKSKNIYETSRMLLLNTLPINVCFINGVQIICICFIALGSSSMFTKYFVVMYNNTIRISFISSVKPIPKKTDLGLPEKFVKIIQDIFFMIRYIITILFNNAS